MSLVQKIILILLRAVPFISFTCDSCYDDYRLGAKLRISLLRFSFGTKIYYFFSFYEKKFSLFKGLALDDISPWPNLSKFDQAISDYREHSKGLGDEGVEVELDYIKDSIGLATDTKNHFHTKVSIYLVILSIFIPLFISLLPSAFGRNFDSVWGFIFAALSMYGVYFLVGIINILIKYMASKSYEKPTFKELKTNPSKQKLLEMYYAHKVMNEAQNYCISNYVLNLEQKIFWFFITAAVSYLVKKIFIADFNNTFNVILNF
ncbi:hypothetical protein [Desulfovibrio sp. JC010]|uniref:hypothetical protein n=1 Tax=Desulfovibrio sp. JC010 TaxID=2593641 RepID=UPI0013D7689D|nr:hypothetical protein [Desulfovibrio sp. JC010]NDV28583.1 hypothetical protein [Desulfovibrio sp. JC010]